jgi:hypothetical protein
MMNNTPNLYGQPCKNNNRGVNTMNKNLKSNKMPENRNLGYADCASQHGCDAEDRGRAVSTDERE